MSEPMRLVRTGDLLLEPQLAAHADEMFAVLSDPQIYTFLADTPPLSAEALRTRYRRLETRRSPDDRQQWLNWIVRTAAGEAAGYVQATAHPEGDALVAYVLASRFWGRGIGRRAVAAMLRELADHHEVRQFFAIAARQNARSLHLLGQLGFSIAAGGSGWAHSVAPGELLFTRHQSPATEPIDL